MEHEARLHSFSNHLSSLAAQPFQPISSFLTLRKEAATLHAVPQFFLFIFTIPFFALYLFSFSFCLNTLTSPSTPCLRLSVNFIADLVNSLKTPLFFCLMSELAPAEDPTSEIALSNQLNNLNLKQTRFLSTGTHSYEHYSLPASRVS